MNDEYPSKLVNHETLPSGTSFSETDIFLLKNSSYSCQQSVGSDKEIPRMESFVIQDTEGIS